MDLPFALPPKKYIKDSFAYEILENGVKGENFEIEFKNGMISRYIVDRKILLNDPMKMNFYRKPTDNDGIKGKHENLINEWDRNMPQRLPRAGVVFELPKEYDSVQWYGRGPHENYADRKHSSVFGLYKSSVSDMSVAYERPQENGNRCDTYFVKIGDLMVVGSDTFEFSVHDYKFASLMKAQHKGEIEKSDKNYLYIDYKQRGLGSASCGPQPEEEYEFRPHSFRFVFMLRQNNSEEYNFEFDVKTQRLSDSYEYKKAETAAENFDCRE